MSEDTAARQRAAHVAALQTEREYLARQPEPDASRISEVDKQLDVYSDKPTARKRETRKEA